MPWAYVTIVLSVILAAVFWSAGWAVASGLMAILVLHVRNLHHLDVWLNSRDSQAELPDMQGVWGRIFERIAQLHVKHFKSEQELTASIIRIKKSANALSEGVVTIDANGLLEWWNRSAQKMLGLNKAQDRGAPLVHLLREPDFFRYYQRADYTHPVLVNSPANPEQVLEVAITELAKGDHFLIIRDITDSLNLEKMRRDFISNVSHELRTPLTAIQGYLEIFQTHHPELDADIQKIHLRMLAQTHRMTHLVQDLLVLSRLEDNINQPEVVYNDMTPLLNQVVDEAGDLAQKLNKKLTINLYLKSQKKVTGVEAEILSVLTNLMTNAVKYTQHAGCVDITWYETDDGLCCSVVDDGVGIAQQHLPRLTERFYRVDPSRSSASGGTGLGLAIVQRIMLRHKGRLHITSQEGQGSHFTCVFPH